MTSDPSVIQFSGPPLKVLATPLLTTTYFFSLQPNQSAESRRAKQKRLYPLEIFLNEFTKLQTNANILEEKQKTFNK